MDGYKDGWMNRCNDGLTDGYKDGWINAWLDGWVDRRKCHMDEQMERWSTGR